MDYSDKEIEEMKEKYRKIFTIFQKLDKELADGPILSPFTKDKWEKILAQQQINALNKQMILAQEQISEMKKYTKWFIGLTIVIIATTVITTLINIIP